MAKKIVDNNVKEHFGHSDSSPPRPNCGTDWKPIVIYTSVTIIVAICAVRAMKMHIDAKAIDTRLQNKKEIDLVKEELKRKSEALSNAIIQKMEESLPPKVEEPPKV